MARKQHHEEHVNHERWLVSYADFITLLFAFFVVMYAVSRVDTKRVAQAEQSVRFAMHFKGTGGVGELPVFQGPPSEGGCVSGLSSGSSSSTQIQSNVKAVRKRLVKALKPLLSMRDDPALVQIRVEGNRLAVSLSAPSFFDPGRASLKPEALSVLDAVAAELAKLGRPVRVEGHTDDRPPNPSYWRDNWDLSAARAATVVSYLAATGPIPAERLSAVGYGSTRPLASNDTAAGRRANRRLDLVVELAPASMSPWALSTKLALE